MPDLDLARLRAVAEAEKRYVDEWGPDPDRNVLAATFDPPTLLVLLDRLEAAEAAEYDHCSVAFCERRRGHDGPCRFVYPPTR